MNDTGRKLKLKKKGASSLQQKKNPHIIAKQHWGLAAENTNRDFLYAPVTVNMSIKRKASGWWEKNEIKSSSVTCSKRTVSAGRERRTGH